jgi:hypothetical protein
MAILSRQRFTEGFLSIGSIAAVVTVMAAIDESVRIKLADAVSGGVSSGVVLAGANLQRTAHMAMATVHDYGAANTPMVFFVLVAVALFVLMLKP